MVGKSKIDIFKNMSEEELIKAIKKNRYDGRYFERLLAIKMFVQGEKIIDIADFLELSYPTVHSWIKICEKFGIEGLKPNFGGGRPSKLTDEQKIKLQSYIDQEENINLTDIQKIMADKMHIKMCLSSVSENVKKMGYNFGKPRPIFKEAPKNRIDILKKES